MSSSQKSCFFLAFLPPSVMLPSNRLETLITQAFELQQEKCLFHNTSTSSDIREASIIVDHQCSKYVKKCFILQRMASSFSCVKKCKLFFL